MDVREIRLDEIVPSKELRSEGSDVSELVESIREHGLLQPIRVRPIAGGMYHIIAGNRRFMAHRALGANTISAVVVEESDETAAVQAIVENLQREDLTPFELAKGIRELAVGFGLSILEVARAVSKSPATVQTWLRLSRLPEDVLLTLDSGERGTQSVTGLTPRNLQPFVRDLPSEEEVARDPAAAARFQDRVATVVRFQEEVDRRGIRVNAHMSDEIARRARTGQMTLEEAIDEVLAHPEQYRYARPTPEALQYDTWDAYRRIHEEMSVLAHKLRPEIAVGFTVAQKRDLLGRLSALVRTLEGYEAALRAEEPASEAVVPQLPSGDQPHGPAPEHPPGR